MLCHAMLVRQLMFDEWGKKTMDITNEIYEERERGKTYPELSKKYGISIAACRKRYELRKKKYELQENKVFMALQAVNGGESRTVRVANMLSRNGIYTVEQFMALTEEECRMLRNCGDFAVQLILSAQVYIKAQDMLEE